MQVPADRADHVRLTGRSVLAQRVRLDVLIEQFVRIQFGAVARQADQSQALRVLRDEFLDGGGPMHRMSVNDQVGLAWALSS
ncbi:hypothetical protein WJ95_23915 [Burkholderia ubonensis]|nr:hypothetical protein WJ95_23915 [Burkholderia ubonensis]